MIDNIKNLKLKYQLKNSKNNSKEERKKYNYFNMNIQKDFEKFKIIENKKFNFDKNIEKLYQYEKSYILEYDEYYILIRDLIEKSFYINKFYFIEKFENEKYQKMNMRDFINEKNFIILEDYKINDKIIIILNHIEDIEEKKNK